VGVRDRSCIRERLYVLGECKTMRAFLCLGMFVSVRHRVMDGGSLEFSKLLSTLCEHSVKVV